MTTKTDVVLTDPYSSWVIDADGWIVLTFDDGTGNFYRVIFQNLYPLTQLSTSLTDAAATKFTFDNEGFGAACRFVDKIYEAQDEMDIDDTLSDEDLDRLLGE
jgi:hypothetical protein